MKAAAAGRRESEFDNLLQKSRALISAETLPDEQAVLDLLKQYKEMARIALSDVPHSSSSRTENNSTNNATSSLLDDLDSGKSRRSTSSKTANGGRLYEKAAATIPSMLYELIQDPKIFISPRVLREYTEIQCLLKKADYLPTAFSLYASKPAPRASGSKIKYTPTNPNSPKNAVPKDLADRALDVAIEQQNLPLALAIIDESVCAPAFKRDKLLRKASLPAVAAAASPLGAYVIASYVASLQSTMDVGPATWISFSAIMAYVGFTSIMGVVALTTANDHMNRVVWIPGRPLRQRWLREEERAALDKVAAAWGFKDPLMRGQEEGEDWETLREILGMRGMILDKSDLMEGME
jgi:hypothetical protein